MDLDYNKLRLDLATKILIEKVKDLPAYSAYLGGSNYISQAFNSAEDIISEFKYRNSKKPNGEFIKEPANTLIHHYKCRGCGELDKAELSSPRNDLIEHACSHCGHKNLL